MDSFINKIIRRLVRLVPERKLAGLIAGLARDRVKSMAPDESLRMLLRLDQDLYELTGSLAVAYGQGRHTKHKHTGYHDFFVARCRAGEKALDVGCGMGELSHDLAARGHVSVTGIDKDERKIAEAKKRYSHPKLSFQVAGATGFDLQDSFDVVVMSNVLEHVKDRQGLLKELIRATGGARMLIRVPLFERDWRVPLKKELGVEWRLDPTHETEYTQESFAREMADAGLEITSQEVRWGEIWAETKPKKSN